MILLPTTTLDGESIEMHPKHMGGVAQTFLSRTHNLNILGSDISKEPWRRLNVPYCLNIMEGGTYSSFSQFLFTSISDREIFRLFKKKTSIRGERKPEKIELHQHDYFEIMYVFEGEVEQRIEKGSYHYRTGQACLLNRNTRHYEVLGDNYILVFICISKEYLQGRLLKTLPSSTILHSFFSDNLEEGARHKKDYLEFKPVGTNSENPIEVSFLMEEMMKELIHKKPGYLDVVAGFHTRILMNLADSAQYKISHVVLDSTKEAYLFDKITQYIIDNGGNISRSNIQKELNYSSDYLNRIVKKHCGMNLSEYARTFLLKRATEFLLNSDMSISQIIHALGFKNHTHFYKLFYNLHGMTPKEYRDIYKVQ